MEPKWITWAKALQAISQTGLHYSTDPYDSERYRAIGDVAAEIVSENSDLDKCVVKDLYQREFGYATPKVDVRGVAFQDGKILLVREVADGLWTLPGGWADVNETPAEAVVREVREESGFEVKAKKLLAVLDRSRQGHVPPFPYHVYKMFFLCTIAGGFASSSDETSEAGFFSPENLPPLSLSRVLPSQINRFFEHDRHPDWPTEYD